MKKFLIKGSLTLCIALATVSCSKDDNQAATPEKEVDKGTVKTADLLGKWRLVKTTYFNDKNELIKTDVASNGDCSTPTTYFLENDKVIINTYSLKDGKCQIDAKELDGRWRVANNTVYVHEDWDVTNPNRKEKPFAIVDLTKTDLALSYTLTAEEVAAKPAPAGHVRKVSYYELVKTTDGTNPGNGNGTNPDNGNTTIEIANLMKKWRLVKTVEVDKNGIIVSSVVASNGTCSTPTTYFLENDKVIYNTYSLKDGKCQIDEEERDGRWNISKNTILVTEDWNNRKQVSYWIQALTASKLELSRTWTAEEITKAPQDKKNVAKTINYYEVAK